MGGDALSAAHAAKVKELAARLIKVETEWPLLSVESIREGVSETRYGPFLPVLIMNGAGTVACG